MFSLKTLITLSTVHLSVKRNIVVITASITLDKYARKCSVLVPTLPFTTVAVVLFAFLILDVDIACGFFNDTFMMPGKTQRNRNTD
jgi:hypothetical protein